MDIRVRQLSTYGFDVTFRSGDFLAEQGLETAVFISLFTDRRAEVEELPPLEVDTRGWWGDLFATDEGDEIGSKLWLLDRAAVTQDALNRAQEYAEQALQWLIDDGIAERVTVVASFIGRVGYLLEIEIKKPNTNQASNFRYQMSWDGQFAQQIDDEGPAVAVDTSDNSQYIVFDAGSVFDSARFKT